MKHGGKAAKAGLRILLISLVALVVILTTGIVAATLGQVIAALATGLVVVWVLFAGFVISFFRDPSPAVPESAEAIVAPAHGKVDVIEEIDEPEFMGVRCRRISIFLSVFDVHVQNAPVSGRVAHLRHRRGEFLNAMRKDSAVRNENVMIGIESSERAGERIGVRLIAGLIARRIVPWIEAGDRVERGDRIALIQFGSRVDLYLPMDAGVEVKLGDRVRGGETIVARRKAS